MNMMELIEIVKNDCKPFFQQVGYENKLYRGISKTTEPFFIRTVNTNRKPLHTSQEIQELIDSQIIELGKTATRGNSVFCTGELNQASGYGKPYCIIPVGKFHYTYLKGVNDLFHILNGSTINHIIGLVRKNIAGDDGTLKQAISNHDEIYLHCEKVVYIDFRMYEDVIESVRTGKSSFNNKLDPIKMVLNYVSNRQEIENIILYHEKPEIMSLIDLFQPKHTEFFIFSILLSVHRTEILAKLQNHINQEVFDRIYIKTINSEKPQSTVDRYCEYLVTYLEKMPSSNHLQKEFVTSRLEKIQKSYILKQTVIKYIGTNSWQEWSS